MLARAGEELLERVEGGTGHEAPAQGEKMTMWNDWAEALIEGYSLRIHTQFLESDSEKP